MTLFAFPRSCEFSIRRLTHPASLCTCARWGRACPVFNTDAWPSCEECATNAFQFRRRCEIDGGSSSPLWTDHERTANCDENRHEAALVLSKARSDNPRVETVDRDPCALQLFCQLVREENIGK